MTRSINQFGLAIIKASEGCVLHAYRDIRGIWTIAWGHTPATPGSIISQAGADELLLQDLDRFCTAVDHATQDVPTSNNQFSALVSICYNCGEQAILGGGGHPASTLFRMHRAGQFPTAADDFLAWDHAGSVEVPGLLTRRRREMTLYLTVDTVSPTLPLQSLKIIADDTSKTKAIIAAPFDPRRPSPSAITPPPLTDTPALLGGSSGFSFPHSPAVTGPNYTDQSEADKLDQEMNPEVFKK